MSLVNINDVVIYWETLIGCGYLSKVYKAFNVRKQKKWVAKIISISKTKKEDLLAINREIFI